MTQKQYMNAHGTVVSAVLTIMQRNNEMFKGAKYKELLSRYVKTMGLEPVNV